MDKEDLLKWHADEKKWWDKNGDYMTYQWKLTPFLNKILRSKLVKDYENFLLTPKKKMIDIGCGAGWLSLNFANKGMNVLGIDVSKEQIEAAEKLRTKENEAYLKFICCDLINWDCDNYREEFDVVFVNAFLHHLPLIELELVFKKIDYILKSGGKVYMYEPLEYVGKKNIVAEFIDFINNCFMIILLNIIPKVFKLYNTRHQKEVANGYKMASPHERPIDVKYLENITSKSFNILEIKAWHLYSIGFAMQSMGLKKSFLGVYSYITKYFSTIERYLIKSFGWYTFSKPGRFILCSVKMIKK